MTGASDVRTAVAKITTQGGLAVVRLKLVNGDNTLIVLAICDTESSISFVDKSTASTLQLQGRKTADHKMSKQKCCR